MTDFNKSIETLQSLDVSKMYGEDFFLTWENLMTNYKVFGQ